MIVQKVSKYKLRYQNYITYTNDKIEITKNIKEQEWFIKSRDKAIILDILENFNVIDFVDTQTRFSLTVDLGNKINFVIEYKHPRRFRVYYHDLNKDIKGYIAYHRDDDNESNRKLPDYAKIESFLSLHKLEYISLAYEILVYFDIRGDLTKLNIGNSYNYNIKELTTLQIELFST